MPETVDSSEQYSTYLWQSLVIAQISPIEDLFFNLSIWFFPPFLLNWQFSPFHLKEARPTSQHHYSHALWPLLSKIGDTWTQELWYHESWSVNRDGWVSYTVWIHWTKGWLTLLRTACNLNDECLMCFWNFLLHFSDQRSTMVKWIRGVWNSGWGGRNVYITEEI